MAICANCRSPGSWNHCATCKKTHYCSKDCQRSDFKAHKKVCSFNPSSYALDEASTDTLAMLRRTAIVSISSPSRTVTRLFNTSEIRMAVLSLLPAKDLLRVHAVCRLWYRTIALETTLQQRLFLMAGPGPLVSPVHSGVLDETNMAIVPRNKSQLDMAQMTKAGGHLVYLLTTPLGTVEEKQATELEKAKIPIVLTPFFTKLWPQDPKNMTNNPYVTIPTAPKTASWRRMQLTSPPMLQLDMNVRYTDSKGHMDRPSTGEIATGVSMGHLADLTACMPSKRKMCWMQPDAFACWSISADAVVEPGQYHAARKNDSIPGVYVNPSNGIPFPGGSKPQHREMRVYSELKYRKSHLHGPATAIRNLQELTRAVKDQTENL